MKDLAAGIAVMFCIGLFIAVVYAVHVGVTP